MTKLPIISLLASLLVVAAAAAVLLIGLSGYTQGAADRQAAGVRDTVLAYVAQCYALEGAYPPDLEYLAEKYGLQLDTGRYIYFYNIYASNIMPDVRVFVREAGVS
jgi:type II secretory pathway pseudopilin PulG